MQRLHVELLLCLDRHEAHCRPLHGLGDGFGIQEVVLLRFDEGLYELRRDDARVVPLPAEQPG